MARAPRAWRALVVTSKFNLVFNMKRFFKFGILFLGPKKRLKFCRNMKHFQTPMNHRSDSIIGIIIIRAAAAAVVVVKIKLDLAEVLTRTTLLQRQNMDLYQSKESQIYFIKNISKHIKSHRHQFYHWIVRITCLHMDLPMETTKKFWNLSTIMMI